MRKAESTLIALIGSPPDTLDAVQVCSEMGWNMRYESPSYKWQTSDSLPTLNDLKASFGFNERLEHEDRFGYSYNSKIYLIYKTQKAVFIIQPINPRDNFDEQSALGTLVILLSIIILSLYFLIRILFKPVKQLITAVHQVGNGNYYLEIPVKRKDELGELASSISSMASKIGNSIKAKEQLLLDVSHELRTPLTRLKLGLAVGSPPEKINDDIIEMEKMIAGILEGYRDESIISSLKLSSFDLNELLQDTVEEYFSRDRLKFDNNSKVIQIIGDEEKIQTVIRNVITNGLKYSTSDVFINILDGGKFVKITVKDSGVGIKNEDLPYIFEPFFRADQSRTRTTGGYGLGLSICKKIMDAHKAAISVKSKPNEETEFTLLFKKN